MTGTEVGVETQAQRIADRGRDALVERLRIAYGDAAMAHADLISLDEERIEALVQSAADRADGLQWRRALADVASDELGISPTQALNHPAVARALGLVGAPSYEQSVAELIARPVPPMPAAPPVHADTQDAVDQAPEIAEPEEQPEAQFEEQPEAQPEEQAEAFEQELENPEPESSELEPIGPHSESNVDSELPATSEHQAAVDIAKSWPPQAFTLPSNSGVTADQLETVEADDQELALLPEPDPIEYSTEAYDVEASLTEEEAPPTLEPEPYAAPEEDEADDAPVPASAALHDDELEVIVPAVHLGGVANLPTKREGLSVRLSADGLDILQGDNDILGRLIWDEIETLEVPNLRGRRRSKQLRARLVVRTPYGDASFEVPDIAGDELRDRVEPLMRLYGGG